MNDNMFGLKDLYDCVLKATYDMEVGNRKIKAGEPIVVFDSLSLANFDELKSRAASRGGYGNQAWITWETTQGLEVRFSQGIFSKTLLAVLGNAQLKQGTSVSVPMHEDLEIDDNLQVQLKYKPQNIFIYKQDNGEQILEFEINDKTIVFNNAEQYTNIIVYYDFIYEDANIVHVGRQLFSGFLEVTAKTRLKDDVTGKTVTGIIHMPRVKLVSDFSIRLGSDAPPAVGHFTIVAYPTGSKGSEKVMEFISLNDDIDSDI
jgi:hypothetical protein